jgi:hypothetical protein
MSDRTILYKVREYSEGYDVELGVEEDNGREVIIAVNEGGHNITQVDLLDLIAWLKIHKPHLVQ